MAGTVPANLKCAWKAMVMKKSLKLVAVEAMAFAYDDDAERLAEGLRRAGMPEA